MKFFSFATTNLSMLPKITQNSLIYQVFFSDGKEITFSNWILVKGSVSTLLDLCLIVKNIVYCSILLHVIPAAVISCKSLSSSSSWYCYLLSSLFMKGRVRSNEKGKERYFYLHHICMCMYMWFMHIFKIFTKAYIVAHALGCSSKLRLSSSL